MRRWNCLIIFRDSTIWFFNAKVLCQRYPLFPSQGEDYEVKPNSRKRRSFATDANGNRILRVVKRDATEMAEVETTEKVIQVSIAIKDWHLIQSLRSLTVFLCQWSFLILSVLGWSCLIMSILALGARSQRRSVRIALQCGTEGGGCHKHEFASRRFALRRHSSFRWSHYHIPHDSDRGSHYNR